MEDKNGHKRTKNHIDKHTHHVNLGGKIIQKKHVDKALGLIFVLKGINQMIEPIMTHGMKEHLRMPIISKHPLQA